jgi:hypothetical protein
MSAFLAAFTTCEEPDDVRFLLAEGSHVEGSFFEEARGGLSREFGSATRRLSVSGALEEHEHAWRVEPDQIGDALALMDQLPAIPEHLGRGLLVLSIDSVFLLRDPETGQLFPAQGPDLYGGQEADWKLRLGQSRAYLRLSHRSTCALFLSLPFPDVTPDVLAFVRQVQQALPFRLSPAAWSRWQLNRQGTQYYKRRLALDAHA